MPTLRQWLNEPLLHFLLLGGLLFVAYAGINRQTVESPLVVHISESEVAWLQQTWTRQWQRPPDEAELRGLVTDYLKETLLAREASELGLAENDTIVRRRLAQKMKFLVEDTARMAAPSDAVLRQYYEEHAQRYILPAIVSFDQRYFRSEGVARAALPVLTQNPDTDLGETSLLQNEVHRVDEQVVSNLFGRQFAEQIFALDTGGWQGPLQSAYGFHLVRVNATEPAQPLAFEQARERVVEDWFSVQQERADSLFFARLLQKYEVVAEADILALIGPLAEPVQ